MPDQPSQAEKGAALRALHEGDPFVIPNPWDAGSAKAFEALGFQALATTSGGFAFTLGRADGDVNLDEVCGHVRSLSEATPLPISADLENGYGDTPEAAAEAITRAAEAGAVGGSIEDYGAEAGLYDAGLATERVAAAVEAARALDFEFTLTARAENFLRGNPDLDDTIARLRAFEDAGADCLYAPFLRTVEEIEAVCGAVPKPVNVLALPGGLPPAAIFAAGAQRISVGSSFTWVAMGAAFEVARAMRERPEEAPAPLRVSPRELLGG